MARFIQGFLAIFLATACVSAQEELPQPRERKGDVGIVPAGGNGNGLVNGNGEVETIVDILKQLTIMQKNSADAIRSLPIREYARELNRTQYTNQPQLPQANLPRICNDVNCIVPSQILPEGAN